jgi:hypothetical protein
VGTTATALVALTLGATLPEDVRAQEWSWPERAENLQSLPADFAPERLSAVMRGFTQALGVRCSYCHVGEEGQPLSSYDFPSDANPMKDRAREMYALLGVVNDQLADFDRSGERVNVWCHTCHSGKPRPQTLDEAVMERWRAEGSDAAIAYFRDLRSRFFAGPAFDFRPASVTQLGNALVEAGDTTGAQTLLEINVQDSPDSWEVHESLGDLLRMTGDAAGAAARYERALELSPHNPRVTAKLRAVR